LVYDPVKVYVDDRDFAVNYSNQGFVANVGYYFTEDDLEQALVSMVYPINERWEVVGKLHQSLLFDKPVENLLGLSYQSCCWGIKILASQTGNDKENFAITDNAIYFEMTFKGLSQAGEDIDSRLSKTIPGYQPAF
jgi:LPS-assembly protein